MLSDLLHWEGFFSKSGTSLKKALWSSMKLRDFWKNHQFSWVSISHKKKSKLMFKTSNCWCWSCLTITNKLKTWLIIRLTTWINFQELYCWTQMFHFTKREQDWTRKLPIRSQKVENSLHNMRTSKSFFYRIWSNSDPKMKLNPSWHQILDFLKTRTLSHLRNNTFGATLRSIYQPRLTSHLLSILRVSLFHVSLRTRNRLESSQMRCLGSCQLIDMTLHSELACSVGSQGIRDLIKGTNVRLTNLITCLVLFTQLRPSISLTVIFMQQLISIKRISRKKASLVSLFTEEMRKRLFRMSKSLSFDYYNLSVIKIINNI